MYFFYEDFLILRYICISVNIRQKKIRNTLGSNIKTLSSGNKFPLLAVCRDILYR